MARGFGGLLGPGGLIQAGSKGSCPLQGSVSRCFPVTHGHLGLLPVPPFSGLAAVPAAACWMPLPNFPQICSFPFLWLDKKKKFLVLPSPRPAKGPSPSPPGCSLPPTLSFTATRPSPRAGCTPAQVTPSRAGTSPAPVRDGPRLPLRAPHPLLGRVMKSSRNALEPPEQLGEQGWVLGGDFKRGARRCRISWGCTSPRNPCSGVGEVFPGGGLKSPLLQQDSLKPPKPSAGGRGTQRSPLVQVGARKADHRFCCVLPGLPRGWEVDTTLHGGFYFIK